MLLPVRGEAHAFGGSHAQRDVVHRTLLEAAFRSGQHALWRALAIERASLKVHCPFSWGLPTEGGSRRHRLIIRSLLVEET